MTTPENRPARRPHPRLVAHDIRLERHCSKDGVERVVAMVECERRGSSINIEACRYCERFAFIDTHEAGYVTLCRSTDEEVADTALTPTAPQ